MKNLTFVLALTASFVLCSCLAQAQVVNVSGPVPASDNAAVDVFTFDIVGPGAGIYDTINFSTTADNAFNHLENNAGVLNFAAGNQDTDFLGAAIFGAGLSTVGVNDGPGATFSGVITSFGGGDTSTFTGDFAQVVLPPLSRGSYQIDFALSGQPVLSPIMGTYGIPEPGTLVLLTAGLVGICVSRRREI